MTADTAIGAQLRRKRREKALTQDDLAAASGVSQVMIAKTEQGHRVPRLPVLIKLAKALDIPISELIDKRPRLEGHAEHASVLAIRDALLSPALLPGTDPPDGGEPAPAGQLQQSVDHVIRLYRSGEFAGLAAILPALLGDALLTARATGPEGYALLAQAYDMASALMVHMGKEDLAAIGAERAIASARASGDELLHAMELGSYSWVLLHQGRLDEAEQLAASTADKIAPSFSSPDMNVAVYGSLLMTAVAPAASSGRDVGEYLSLAGVAGAKLGRRVRLYTTSFAPATVHMQACHAHAVRREPAKALEAGRKIRPGDLEGISHGRYLLDIAQAHVDGRHLTAATQALTEAMAVSATWFRHQGVARFLIDDLYEQQTRISPALRQLGASVDADWYAPYYRHSVSCRLHVAHR